MSQFENEPQRKHTSAMLQSFQIVKYWVAFIECLILQHNVSSVGIGGA